jgi:hypothetical protein
MTKLRESRSLLFFAVNQNVYEQIKSASQSGSVGPNSNDMIPPLRGLSNLQVSFGLVQDVNMYQADTILGKRAAEEEEVQGGRLDLTLGLNYGGDATMGRAALPDQNQQRNVTKPGVITHKKVVATGHVKSGKKARPNVWSRQAQ